VALDDAYTSLVNALGGQDTAIVAVALIKASFDSDAVLGMVVPALREQGNSVQQMITRLVGTVEPDNTASALQVTIAGKLTALLVAAGDSLSVIADTLLEMGWICNRRQSVSKTLQ
jgi:hypothetical protein